MNEQSERAKLVKALKAADLSAVIFRHEDIFTAGIPDISITRRRRTLWVEVKYQTSSKSKPKGRGVQALNMALLAQHGLALYVVYGLSSVTVLRGLDPIDIRDILFQAVGRERHRGCASFLLNYIDQVEGL